MTLLELITRLNALKESGTLESVDVVVMNNYGYAEDIESVELDYDDFSDLVVVSLKYRSE